MQKQYIRGHLQQNTHCFCVFERVWTRKIPQKRTLKCSIIASDIFYTSYFCAQIRLGHFHVKDRLYIITRKQAVDTELDTEQQTQQLIAFQIRKHYETDIMRFIYLKLAIITISMTIFKCNHQILQVLIQQLMQTDQIWMQVPLIFIKICIFLIIELM
ncbi:Hypothetical_protein [Hexamita inflata]|uniref:Hypothetical_protein n=1 Tax=Hexamita inflata TaxID=28002 RepID=A0AA86N505_9EUKA|nr:Hypothetical protein HINF_LOCUS551 [Hexamita inflata]